MVQRRFLAPRQPRITATTVAATISGITAFYYQCNNRTDSEGSPPSTSSSSTVETTTEPTTAATSSHIGIFETDFTEKLAAKPYLTYHNPFARNSIITSTVNTTKRVWGKFTRDDVNPIIYNRRTTTRDEEDDIALVGGGNRVFERPKGVPRRIRILSIDVPELREVFDGECRVNLCKIYPDDIAKPKMIKIKVVMKGDSSSSAKPQQKGKNLDEGQNNDSEELQNTTTNLKEGTDSNEKLRRERLTEVEGIASKKDEIKEIRVLQKSLARSLVRCRNVQSKRIGIEILEASVYDLNPYNMRRTYQFGSLKYDPGKYTSAKPPGETMLQRRNTIIGGVPVHLTTQSRSRARHVIVTREQHSSSENDEKKKKETKEITVLATDEDEINAPWNQYAWIEELSLRINGFIPFSASVERSAFLPRLLYGRYYRKTVKSSRSWLRWFIPSFLSGERAGDEEGIDGDYGKNMRTVNRASSKPHAVIADGSAIQRVPGSLRYLTKCCQEADVPLFIINDPRVWGGNTHTDLESAVKDMRRTVKARIVTNALTIKEGKMFERGRLLGKLETEAKWQVKDAGRRTRKALREASARLKKERKEDWSNLSGEELLQQLVNKNVITVAHESKARDGEHEGIDAEVISTFAELCHRYVLNLPRGRSEIDSVDVKDDDTVDENNIETKANA